MWGRDRSDPAFWVEEGKEEWVKWNEWEGMIGGLMRRTCREREIAKMF